MEASPGERVVVNQTVPNWTADPQGYDPNGWFFLRSFAGEPNRIADGLKPMYAEEAIVGVEMEVARRTSIGLTYVDKVTSDIFEDTCSGNWPTPTPTADCDHYVVANLPQLTRDYQGFLLDVESRVTDWLHILGSYGLAYSEPRGSAEANENHRLDRQAAKGFRLGKDNRFELIASIYNVLDDEQAIRVCTRSRGCRRDIEVGDPTRYREPRRFEAGVRFEF